MSATTKPEPMKGISMTIKELIERQKSLVNGLVARYNEATESINDARSAEVVDDARIDELRAVRAPITAELTTARGKLAEYEAEAVADAEVQRMQSTVTPVTRTAGDHEDRTTSTTTVREPRTYSKEKSLRGESSFFVDAYRAQYASDFKASERLTRHMVEVEREGELTQRAQTTGAAAGLVIPQYLVDQAALVARAGRPIANSIGSIPLPDQGMSLIIPQGVIGAAVASQATENVAVQNTDETWQNVTVPVVTIAGQQDISRQFLERGAVGIDQIVYTDLAGAYAAELDRQVVNGSGASNQMLGILQTASTNQSTAFVAAATVATFYTKTAGQVNAVQTTRFMAPTIIWVHPQRWNWLISQLDSSNRPLAVPNQGGPNNAVGVYDSQIDVAAAVAAGWMLGLPVVTDANIPVNIGSGPEDVAIVARKEDLLLWEDGDGMPRELRFDQTLGNQLTTKLVAYGYAAFTAARYPKAVGKVGGNSAAGFGLVAPSF